MRVPPLQPLLFWQVCLLFWCAGILSALWPFEGLCAVFLLFLADRRLRTLRSGLLALMISLAGLGMGYWQLGPIHSVPHEPAWLGSSEDGKNSGSSLGICGLARHVQGLPDRRLRVILEDVRPKDDPEAKALEGGCVWTWDEAAFRVLPGQMVCVNRRPVPIRGFANAPEAEQEAWWAAQGVFWRFWSRGLSGEPSLVGEGSAPALWRDNLLSDFVRVLGGKKRMAEPKTMQQAQAILPALLFGDRSYLVSSTIEKFAAASLAHSLALSGQHLALAGLIGLYSVLLLARRRPEIYLFRARTVLVALASFPPALAYLWLGNAPASLLRATCMLCFVTVWLLRARSTTALDALLAALGVIVLADPLSLFDLSLQLSVLCVAVIGLAAPGLRRLWPKVAKKTLPTGQKMTFKSRVASGARMILHIFGSIFLVSLCIQICLLPFMLPRFGSIGLWFPLNVIWLPAVDLVVLPFSALGLVCSLLGLDLPARAILDLAALPCRALLGLLGFLDQYGLLEGTALLRPHWTTLAAFAALCIALALMVGDGRPKGKLQARRWLVAGLLLLCVGPALRLGGLFHAMPRLDMLDVGQGLAVELRLPNAARILVDGGGMNSPRFDSGKKLLAPLIADNASPALDVVINSHPDLDHAGGLVYLLRAFSVARLFHNGRDASGALRQSWREAREMSPDEALGAGDVLVFGDGSGYKLEVLHPPRMGGRGEEAAKENWTGNSASLVLRLTHNGKGEALFTGDAEPHVLKHLLAEGADLSARILVAPHHGSDRSFLPEFYQAVRPELVLAGCGFRNRWGYPGKRLRSWLAERRIPLLDTGNYGRISVHFPASGSLDITTARENP